MSENKQNLPTDHIGGGDDSQNRFEKVFIVKVLSYQYDGVSYLSKDRFIDHFNESMEYKPDCPKSEWSREAQTSDKAIEMLLSGQELIECQFYFDNTYEKVTEEAPIFYSLVEAYSNNGKYFVQVEVK